MTAQMVSSFSSQVKVMSLIKDCHVHPLTCLVPSVAPSAQSKPDDLYFLDLLKTRLLGPGQRKQIRDLSFIFNCIYIILASQFYTTRSQDAI